MFLAISSARRDWYPHLLLTGPECSTPLHHQRYLIEDNNHTSCNPSALPVHRDEPAAVISMEPLKLKVLIEMIQFSDLKWIVSKCKLS